MQSNTILSTSSSLFTFLFSLAFLGEKFTWLKLAGVLLCMGGTIIVSLGDSETGLSVINSNPILGDILALTSSAMYAVYVTLIRKKLPDDEKNGQVSMAQFLGFLGFFNTIFFFPVLLVLNFTKRESFTALNWKQFGLIVGKGLFLFPFLFHIFMVSSLLYRVVCLNCCFLLADNLPLYLIVSFYISIFRVCSIIIVSYACLNHHILLADNLL